MDRVSKGRTGVYIRRTAESGQQKVRIVLADDNFEHLMGIRELISLETDFEIAATSTSADIALSLIKKCEPDIVLMDINMPEKDGLTAAAEIVKSGLKTKVIALTSYDDPDLIYRAMKIGAKGYVLKTMASSQLISAIEDVMQGKIYLPSGLSSKFFEYFQKTNREEHTQASSKENLLQYLTQREEEVLELLTQGVTYKGVASKLFISETTVKTHVNNIFQKLQVNDRTQAVLYAINNGFLNRKKLKMAV